MLQVGDKLRSFSLKQTDGETIKSSELKGQTTIIYFYPKDDTPGCTKQACSLRDGYDIIKKRGVVIIGISPDSIESHQLFTTKYQLPFPLLADPDHRVAEQFGVWVEKNVYGKKSMGIARTTFIADADGKILSILQKVDTENHAEQILAELATLDKWRPLP